VIRAAQRGDLGAFEEIVRRYQADLWRLALHLTHNETSAHDVTQEAFVRAYRFLSRYRGDSKFSTWLVSITRNCALDELRRGERHRRITARLEAEPVAAAGSREEGLGMEVREALSLLPLELREPIVMIDVLGASYREVAEIVGAPVGTVKSRVHRGRGLLAGWLLHDDTGTADQL
jgi:RNA polymerase sigma-70 factor (ECF subfamily)